MNEQVEAIDNVEGEQNTPPDVPESPTSDFLSNPDVLDFIEKKVLEGVHNALRGQTPKANKAQAGATQKSEFERMTYKERLELFKGNPSEYNRLAKGGL